MFELTGGLTYIVPLMAAAVTAKWVGDAFGGPYGTRVAVYLVLMVYVLVGAGVLFVKVAQHETTALSPRRVGLWLLSLWVWPALLLAGRK